MIRNSFPRRYSLLVFIALTSNLPAQQVPAWRTSQSQPPIENLATVRLLLKSNAQCEKNIIELQDIADLSGSEAILQSIRNLPLGPAPVIGSRQTWTQGDVLRLLQLRGIDPKIIRWGGDDACQVIRSEPKLSDKSIEYTPSNVAPQSLAIAERTVTGVIATYLRSKSSDAATWTIKPTVPNESIKLLSQRSWIKGIAGGSEPWTGKQNFSLLVKTAQGEQSIEISATIQVPSMVWGATGPLAKGHVIDESDLKLVRLTSSMKAAEEDCFYDIDGLIGKELRRTISTGQPILHGDAGPPRIVHARDLVEIHVVAGAIVAQTAGRAMQSGGIDEVIEVEVVGSKKRLAARIVGGNLVEAIAR